MAALKGKKPHEIEKRLKLLLYGRAGVGKTMTAIQFPQPYVIDTERGAENEQYVKAIEKAGGALCQLFDADELIAEAKSLMTEDHAYRTLAIDPLTPIYADMVDKSAVKNGTDFGRHKIEPDRKIKQLCQLLLRLDMNVIITSHAKAKWIRGRDAAGKETIIEDGQTFDCYGRLDYLFDLVLEVVNVNGQRMAVVRKTRLTGFPEGESFPLSYEEIAKRYGKQQLERKSDTVTLATVEQVAELKRLIELLSYPEADSDKWLTKAGAETFDELTQEQINSCITLLKKKVTA